MDGDVADGILGPARRRKIHPDGIRGVVDDFRHVRNVLDHKSPGGERELLDVVIVGREKVQQRRGGKEMGLGHAMPPRGDSRHVIGFETCPRACAGGDDQRLWAGIASLPCGRALILPAGRSEANPPGLEFLIPWPVPPSPGKRPLPRFVDPRSRPRFHLDRGGRAPR